MANLRTIIFASAERALDIPKFDSKMIGHILATSFIQIKFCYGGAAWLIWVGKPIIVSNPIEARISYVVSGLN